MDSVNSDASDGIVFVETVVDVESVRMNCELRNEFRFFASYLQNFLCFLHFGLSIAAVTKSNSEELGTDIMTIKTYFYLINLLIDRKKE